MRCLRCFAMLIAIAAITAIAGCANQPIHPGDTVRPDIHTLLELSPHEPFRFDVSLVLDRPACPPRYLAATEVKSRDRIDIEVIFFKSDAPIEPIHHPKVTRNCCTVQRFTAGIEPIPIPAEATSARITATIEGKVEGANYRAEEKVVKFRTPSAASAHPSH